MQRPATRNSSPANKGTGIGGGYRDLLPHAEEILHRLHSLKAGGEIRFGAYPSAAAWLFPQVVRHLPDTIRLLLREGPSVDLESALIGGDIDLAIRPVHPLVIDESLTHEVLWREPLTPSSRRTTHWQPPNRSVSNSSPTFRSSRSARAAAYVSSSRIWRSRPPVSARSPPGHRMNWST